MLCAFLNMVYIDKGNNSLICTGHWTVVTEPSRFSSVQSWVEKNIIQANLIDRRHSDYKKLVLWSGWIQCS